MLVPPDNFALAEDGIYRCAKLAPINYSFLDTLKLKSIVWIDEERPSRLLTQYVEDNKIKLYHIVDTTVLQEDGELSSGRQQDWMVLRPAMISRVLQILLDSTHNHNCLLIDKTAVIVGVLRHIEKWCYSSIVNEYRLYSGDRANYSVENFLELVSVELIPCEEDETDTDDEDELIAGDGSFSSMTHTSSSNVSLRSMSETPFESDSDGNSHSNGIAIRRPSMAMRRLSATGFGSESLSQSNSFSSSKLSMSTSPQIPKNLLKLVEDRRQKKKKEHQHKREHRLREQPQQEQRQSIDSNLRTASSTSTEESQSRYGFYQARKSFKVIDDRDRVVKTTVRVRLPKEEDLPVWFKELRDGWEEEILERGALRNPQPFKSFKSRG